MTYTVSTVRENPETGRIETTTVGTYERKAQAMTAAKRAAGRGAKFDPHYGPSASCYIGSDVTAVIAA